MALAGSTLFVAGPPTSVDEQQTVKPLGTPETQALLLEEDASLAGKKGAILRAVSAADGTAAFECKLPSPPAFDGLIAAGGKLLMSTMDGALMCMQ